MGMNKYVLVLLHGNLRWVILKSQAIVRIMFYDIFYPKNKVPIVRTS